MRVIEIFWDDLTPAKQKDIQETLGIDDNNNWDVCPLALLEIDED